MFTIVHNVFSLAYIFDVFRKKNLEFGEVCPNTPLCVTASLFESASKSKILIVVIV